MQCGSCARLETYPACALKEVENHAGSKTTRHTMKENATSLSLIVSTVGVAW